MFNQPVAHAVIIDDISDPIFKDLHQAAPYAQESIRGVKEAGLMSGFPDGDFRPYEPMTREQIATILVRALKLQPLKGATGFDDVNQDLWSAPNITAVAKAGVMNGDGKWFRPTEHITREELAVLLVRAMNVDVKGKGARLTLTDSNAISTWARDYVQAAMELGLVSGDDAYFRPQELAQRQDVAVMAMNLHKAKTTDWAVISNMDNGLIVVNGVSYKIGSNVQGILNPGNWEILKHAKIRYVANNKVIEKITGLEVFAKGNPSDKADFASNIVLDGRNGRIDGNVIINSDYVTLKDLTVTGDVQLTPTLKNAFYSNNLTVLGKLIASGFAAKVVTENSRLSTVDLREDFVHYTVKGSTSLSEVVASSPHVTIVSTGTVIPRVVLSSSVQGVEINAPVSHLTVKNPLRLTLSGNARVQDLVLPTGLALGDVLENYDKMFGMVKLVNGAAPTKFAVPPQTTPTTPTIPTTPTTPSTPTVPTQPESPVRGNIYGFVYKTAELRREDRVTNQTRMDVNIEFRKKGKNVSYITYPDDNGQFSYNLEDGEYEVFADSMMGHYADSKLVNVTIRNGKPTTSAPLILILQTPQIKGTIRDENGQIPKNAYVSVSHPTLGLNFYFASANEFGEYVIAGLPPGNYSVALSSNEVLAPQPDMWRITGNTTTTTVRDYVLGKARNVIEAPEFKPYKAGDKSVSGTAVPNGKVFLFQNNLVIGTATVGADGKFVTDYFEPIDPRQTIYAQAVDAKGHVSFEDILPRL